jgi:hypothetical protein
MSPRVGGRRTNHATFLTLLAILALAGPRASSAQPASGRTACFDPSSKLKPAQQAWRCWLDENASREPDHAPSSSQASSPAGSSVSPDVTGKASFPDLVGVALDSAFGTGSPDQAVTLQLSPFAIEAAIDKTVVDNPDRYESRKGLRRIGLSATFGGKPDDDSAFAKGQAGSAATRNVSDIVVLQGSYRAVGTRDRRDYPEKYRQEVANEQEALNALLVKIAQDPDLTLVLGLSEEEQCNAFLAYLRRHADVARSLTKTVQQFEADLDRVNQDIDRSFLLTFRASAELRKEFVGRDKYRFGLVAEGLLGPVDFTGNAEYRIDQDLGGGSDQEFRFALMAAGKLLRKSAVSENGLDLSLSGSGQFRNRGRDTILSVNLKLEYPLAGGLSIPFSITYANHSETLKDKIVRGNFGISYDLSALKGKGKGS